MIRLILTIVLVILMCVFLVMSYCPSVFVFKKEHYGDIQRLKKIKRLGTILFFIMIIIMIIVL